MPLFLISHSVRPATMPPTGGAPSKAVPKAGALKNVQYANVGYASGQHRRRLVRRSRLIRWRSRREARGFPIPRQKIRDLVRGVSEPSLWIDVVEFACPSEGIDGGRVVPSGIGREQPSSVISQAPSHSHQRGFDEPP
jgi:hypothetical protein